MGCDPVIREQLWSADNSHVDADAARGGPSPDTEQRVLRQKNLRSAGKDTQIRGEAFPLHAKQQEAKREVPGHWLLQRGRRKVYKVRLRGRYHWVHPSPVQSVRV